MTVQTLVSLERRGQGGQILHRLLRGLAANVLGQLLGLATRILLVPLYLGTWGVQLYGDWILLSSLVAYLALTDAGASIYIVNRMTQEYARQDYGTLRQVLHSGLALFLGVPTVVFTLFAAIVFGLAPSRLLGIQQTDADTATLVLLLLAAQFMVSLPNGLLLGTYRALGLAPRAIMLGNALAGLQLVSTALALWFGAGMVTIAALQILPYLAIGLVVFVDLTNRVPVLRLHSLSHANWSVARGFARPSLHFLSIQLSSALSIQGTALIAGVLLGSTQLVLFATMRTMVNSIKGLLSVLGNTAWPEITRLDAVQDKERLRSLFRGLLRTTMVAALLSMVVLHVLGARVFELWLKQAVTYHQEYLDLFLVYIVQAVFWTACGQVLMAVNAHHALSRTVLAAAGISVLLSAIGAQVAGVGGIIVGLIAADVLLPLWLVPVQLSRYEPSLGLGFYVAEAGPALLFTLAVLAIPLAWLVVVPALALWWFSCPPIQAGISRWRSIH